MERRAGAWCDGSAATFRLADPASELLSVRLECAILGHPSMRFAPADRHWELRVDRPEVARIEYRLALTHRDGRTETVCDPANPQRVPGGYGESSVVSCPDYREPGWLTEEAAAGGWRTLTLPAPTLQGEVAARVWSPRTPTDRVLVAHDGPDYERYAALSRFAATAVAAGRVAPFHLVLLPAEDRFEWYAASPAYAKGLAREILPKLAGLFLQSGSFFQPRFDAQESGFARYRRIVRFVGRVVRAVDGPAVPVAMTCGRVEENLANNRSMAQALRRQGCPVALEENRDAHTWIGWRDALDPSLTRLLQRVWS